MARQVVIGRVNQIPKGEGRTFEVNGLHIAVYHTASGEVFATQPNCPHRGGPAKTVARRDQAAAAFVGDDDGKFSAQVMDEFGADEARAINNILRGFSKLIVSLE
jgi:nitrite reductase/ring-hydroxylating ferredoxin subunit